MSDIRFVKAEKRYGDTDVIRDLDLHVEKGEFMVLVGPSGCAKSTTLRMIAGLEAISGGDLFIGGQRANPLTPAQRNISMVFQSYALFPNMSVRGNLSFGLKLRKTDSARVAEEVGRVARMLGLDGLLDRKPRQLSGGQAQRVALGRAMIRKPEAFLFDEPLSNLDAELRVQMRGEISQMQRDLATTTVYVTHDQVEAMTMGDRIAVMDKGRIMQVGEPTELYERPSNVFAAGFIGSPRMNLVGAEKLLAVADPTSDPTGGVSGIIGIRPEHLLINATEGALALGEARVTRVENLGHEAHLHVRTSNGTPLIARVNHDIRQTVQASGTVSVSVDYGSLHTFYAASGERMP